MWLLTVLFRKHPRYSGDGDEEQERLQSEAKRRQQLHAEVPGGDVGAGEGEALDAVHLAAAEEPGWEQVSLFSPEENADGPGAESESFVLVLVMMQQVAGLVPDLKT